MLARTDARALRPVRGESAPLASQGGVALLFVLAHPTCNDNTAKYFFGIIVVSVDVCIIWVWRTSIFVFTTFIDYLPLHVVYYYCVLLVVFPHMYW